MYFFLFLLQSLKVDDLEEQLSIAMQLFLDNNVLVDQERSVVSSSLVYVWQLHWIYTNVGLVIQHQSDFRICSFNPKIDKPIDRYCRFAK